MWIDALSNYLTGLGFDLDGDSDPMVEKYWPADLHLIGKDIIRFHTIYWPIMLMALDIPLPKQVFGHPWLLVGEGKMSKSKGNVIYADDLVDYFGVDAVRYFVLHEMPFDNDGSITWELMVERMNSDLANILGNLVNRTISMTNKYFDGLVSNPGVDEPVDEDLKRVALETPGKVAAKMDKLRVADAISEIFTLFRRCNKYIDETEPWKLAKDEAKKDRLATVLYNLMESIRIAAICLKAFLPDTAEKMLNQLNTNERDFEKLDTFGLLEVGGKVVEGDVNRLKGLENRLMEKVIGQDEAVTLVANAIKRSRIQLTLQKRPASFIFVGPTGVGKTELVKQLSMELFDTPETLIRLDMSEFMEKHSVSRLIGSPPGYVGYDEAGQLTEKVRRKPYSIILFDEIEKAHPDVMNILLQILDEGKTNDAHGRTVSFANTVIIMTSNAGSQKAETSLGFGKSAKDISKEKVLKALNEFLRPEFIGRVDEIVVFNPLSEEDYKNIAILMLNEIKTVLKDKGIELIYDENTPSAIVSKMDGNVRGARDLRNVIRRNIEDKISTLMIDNLGTTINKILITSDNNNINVTME